MKFNRQQFIDDARALVEQGVIFRHQGSDPATGMDCINLPRYLYEKQGLYLPVALAKEFEAYHEQPDGQHLLAIMRQWFIEIETDKAEPADMLILYARRNPQHLAIKIGENLVIEAYRQMDKKIGKLIEQPLDSRRRIAAVFRFPDFA